MVRHKLFILPILCLILLQGCVHGTLDDCPPMVRYAVAFTYTNHAGTKDRFNDDVKKINLYVFDENNLIYTTTTELSPYEENFNIPLDIPMGKYHIIAWGNALDDQPFSITPETFEKNVTTIDEARLTLQRIADNLSQTELEKLFYGDLEVSIPLYISRIDTIPLTNNTNRVRVVLHWDHSGTLGPTEQIVNYNEVYVRLQATNAKYKFNDNSSTGDSVLYAPYRTFLNDSILKTDNNTWQTLYYYDDRVSAVTNSTVYDFSILRIFEDSPLNLIVQRRKLVFYYNMIGPDSTNLDSKINLVGINETEGYKNLFYQNGVTPLKMQTTFDKYEYYRVDLYARFDELANTYFSSTLNLTQWIKHEQGNHGGAN